MLKTAFYGVLSALAVLAALSSPLYGAIAVIESYMLHPVLYSPELASVRIQLVITVAFLVGLFLHGSRGLPPVAGEAKLLTVLSLYGMLAMLSGLWAVRKPEVSFPYAFDLCKTIFVTVLLVYVPANPGQVLTLLWAILMGASHAAFMHTVGVNIGYLPPSLGRGEYGALPDFQGSVMIFVLPSFLLITLFGQSWKERLFCLLSLPLIADSIVNTYQRTFFVAAAVQCGYMLIMARGRDRLKLAVVTGLGAVVASALFMPPDYWAWMNSIKTYKEEASAASRLTIGTASLNMLADYPFGVGYRNYQFVSPNYLPNENLTVNEFGERIRAPHSTHFSVACETGILGFVLFGWAFGGAALLLRRTRILAAPGQLDPLALHAFGLEAGIVGWAAAGFFQSLHETDPVFWAIALSILLYRARHSMVTVYSGLVPRPWNAELPAWQQ